MKTLFAILAVFSLHAPVMAQTAADSQKQAVEKYPELAKEGTPLHSKFIELYRQAKETNPTFLQNPDWPITLADKASALLIPPPQPKTEEATQPAKPIPTAPLDAPTPKAQIVIEEAFGKKFGDVFDPATAIGKTETRDGVPIYQFTPDKPFRSLTKYTVLITPKTHRIYSISGIGSFGNNREAANKEVSIIKELLKQKYPKASDSNGFLESFLDGFNGSSTFKTGSRTVIAEVTGNSDIRVEIRYNDDDLKKATKMEHSAIVDERMAAEKKGIENESKKVDASGL